MRLAIKHVSTYAYAQPADRIAIRIKLFPSVYEGQRIVEWKVAANGEAVTPMFMSGFGDEEALWFDYHRPPVVEVVAEGVVETEDHAGVVRGLPCLAAPGVFLRETELTLADDRIRTIAESARRPDPLESMHELSRAVRAAIEYRKGSTNEMTTARSAVAAGVGVCQDHAHAFIAAARACGQPARYVAGYLFSESGEAFAALNETHAWAEAHIPGLGWVGFDPSNEVCPTDRYVRLSCGLDAAGAAPIRGNVLGGGGETLAASVVIAQAQQ